jgi:histidinol-phosphate aminotransferase
MRGTAVTVRDLMRPDLTALEPHTLPPDLQALSRRLGRPVVKLDANENPYGPAPGVAAALSRANLASYPDSEATELRRELSQYLGVEIERIVCSAGGDEMIDLILRLFLEPGDSVIDCAPSFVMYELSAIYNGGRTIRVPRDACFAVDVDAVMDALEPRTKVIFLCNPNNPTGNITPRQDIIRLLETGRLLVLDEAYAEFAGVSHLDLAPHYPNLVVLRTMSKWAALAGVRLGYALVAPEVREEMGKIKSPYNVGVAAQVAGVASLRERGYLMANVRRIVDERERLRQRLEAWGRGTVYPSHTNFLYWATGGVDAQRLREALMRRGVLLRAFPHPIEALRISVGTPEQSEILMDALQEAYGELAG